MISKFTYIMIWILTIVVTAVCIVGFTFSHNPAWMWMIAVQCLMMYETKQLYDY